MNKDKQRIMAEPRVRYWAGRMNHRDLADNLADKIEADEALTPKEKQRYLQDLADELEYMEGGLGS